MLVATLKKPKKKKKAWPIVLLVIFLLLIVLPVGLIYGVFYDPDTKSIHYDENVELMDLGNRIIVDSLDKTVQDERISLAVTENDVDNIIKLGMKIAGLNNQYVNKAYVYVRGNNYIFVVDANAVVIKTRIRVSTTLSENEDGTAFVFSIKDIAIGRLSGIKGIAQKLIDQYLSDSTINGFIASTGLSVTFDKSNLSLVYKKIDLIKDIAKFAGEDMNSLYFDIINTMLTEGLMEFNLSSNKFAEANVDLAALKTNEYATDDAAHIKIQPEEVSDRCRDNILALIDHSNIDPTTVNLDTVFAFLFHGWDYLSEEEKTAISAIDFSYVQIPNVAAYKGFDIASGSGELVEQMKQTVHIEDLLSNDPTRNRYVCTLRESVINQYIAEQSIIGFTTLLHRQTEHGYKLNYITVDNFYCNLYVNSDSEDIAEFVAKLNINGYHTTLAFETTLENTSGTSLTFKVRDLKFGTQEAEGLKEQFFGIICSALNGGDNSISADLASYTISISFSAIMSEAQTMAEDAIKQASGHDVDLTSYFDASNMELITGGSSRDEEGSFSLYLINGISY